jgi:hypothetical protein
MGHISQQIIGTHGLYGLEMVGMFVYGKIKHTTTESDLSRKKGTPHQQQPGA